MLRGVSPGGRHFYPAFPYPSYARMKPADVADLFAYMKTLPAVAGKAPDHQLGFPFNIRRGLGLWKLLLSQRPAGDRAGRRRAGKSRARPLSRRRAGHCGECHTPRDFAGGTEEERMAGRRACRRRLRHRPQHHLGRGRHRLVVGDGYRLLSGERLHARLRFGRRRHGRRPEEHRAAQRRRPRRDRRLSEGGAAAAMANGKAAAGRGLGGAAGRAEGSASVAGRIATASP